jgi:ActR/RegA family two-component response regulator
MISSGRVLIADDEETFLLSTADLLRGAGFDVEAVSSGEAALERLASTEFDLLISDIRMAGNAELQLVEQLQRMPSAPPVILVTGYPSLRTAVPAVHLSVAAYLIKPVAIDEIMAHASKAVEQHRMARSLARMRDRALEWQKDAATLAKAGHAELRGSASSGVASFTSLTVANILGSLNDLFQIMSAQQGTSGEVTHACRTFNCPRHALLQAAVRDAIDTLEITKHSFKSKQLGDLRVRLDNALGGSREDGGT